MKQLVNLHRRCVVGLGLILLLVGGLSHAQDYWEFRSSVGAPTARIVTPNTAIWTGSKMLVWGHSTGANQATVLGDGGAYDPATDLWTTLPSAGAPGPRVAFSSVWTGSEMIIWGGALGPGVNYNDGARYSTALNAWVPVSTLNAPSPRQSHIAVWTGTEMIVWGGWNTYGSVMFGDGARYNPLSDTWSTISSVGAPSARGLAGAVWTGTEVIVWGGYDSLTSVSLGDGARYNPVTDTWILMSNIGAPATRSGLTPIWTGAEMIVADGQGPTSSRARYNPAADTWSPLSNIGAPTGTYNGSPIWTGAELILWGGLTASGPSNGGTRYDPSSDTWAPMTLMAAPSPRSGYAAVWTGTEVIVWGGTSNSNYSLPDGYLSDTYTYVFQADSLVDTTPDPFGFVSVTNVDRGTVQTSNSITVSGINTSAPIEVTDGEYSLDCNAGSFTAAPATIDDGQTVCVRHTSSASFSSSMTTTLNIGGVAGAFTSTTVAEDTTPDAYMFDDANGVSRNVIQISNGVIVSGINSGAPISVIDGLYSINDGPFGAGMGTVQNGDSVRVRHTSAAGFSTTVTTTLNIGRVIGTYSSITEVEDTTPDPFTFLDQSGVLRGIFVTSNVVTITGINSDAAVSISGSSDGTYSVNGEPFVSTPGIVKNGDTVQLRNRVKLIGLNRTSTVTITIGGVSDTWSITSLL